MRPRIIKLLDLALLDIEHRVIDGAAIDARRRARLEASYSEVRLLKLLSEMRGCVLPGSSARDLSRGPDMNSTTQEGASSNDNPLCAKPSAFQRFDAQHTRIVGRQDQSRDGPLYSLKVCMLVEKESDCATIKSPITLSPRRPNRWPLATIQHAELDHGQICSPSHDSAECINLSDDSSLRDATNCWIA